MSLRPNLAGLQLSILRSLSGCKDPGRRDALIATYELYDHEVARAWLATIIERELDLFFYAY